MDGNECLNLASLELVKIFKAEVYELIFHGLNLLAFLGEFSWLFFLTLLEAFSDEVRPNGLKTEESNLGWEFLVVVSELVLH